MSTSGGKALCTCQKCSTNSFVKDGVTYQGLYVHPQTWTKHLTESSKQGEQLARSIVQLSFQEFPHLFNVNSGPLKSSIKLDTKPKPPHFPDPDNIEYQPPSITYCVYISSCFSL
jgi:hypothetical protein